MAKSDLTTASVLAFERKLDPSDALFFSGNWADRDKHNGWPAVELRTKSVRGTISNRLKAKDQKDPAKLDAQIENPNLQTVDTATLPHDADTLKVQFTLKVLGNAGTPSACNNATYQQKLLQTVNGYKDSIGFNTLAQRYAHNLANGRFLWRNLLSAEQVDIHIKQLVAGEAKQSWQFNALEQSLQDFDAPNTDANTLNNTIAAGLAGENFVLLNICAFVRLGAGQEVYPSQELILDQGNKKGGKSKTLYAVDGIASMHSQKIGNAIRTIDTWYDPEGDLVSPIAVEPYGSVTSQGKAYRPPAVKTDFYNLLDSWVLKDKVPATNQQHYVMAILVRGGVFGEAGS